MRRSAFDTMMNMRILQMTDPHLYGRPDGKLRGVETDSSLRSVIDAAFAQYPDYAALLVTGDIVQDDPSGYLRFRSMFGQLDRPVLCVPGNHDEPAAMRRELQGEPFQIGGTRQVGHWQYVMLDSYDPGHVGGRLDSSELQRLRAALENSDAPSMICLHHHPVAMNSRWLDGIGLANAGDFWRIVDAYAHVKAVVWGHVHQVYESERGGIRLFATPSTCAQFLPGSERYALDPRPPAYRSFELHDDGTLESRVHWVESVPAHQSAAG